MNTQKKPLNFSGFFLNIKIFSLKQANPNSAFQQFGFRF